MKSQKASDLRALKPGDLETKLAEARENLRKLVIRKATRQLEDNVSVRFARRDIARISTLMRENSKLAEVKDGGKKETAAAPAAAKE